MENLGLGVQLHAIQLLHISSGGLLELGAAVVGVETVFKFGGLGTESLKHLGKGLVVGFAYAHVYKLGARIGLQSGGLGALDLLEFVDGAVFAEA